MMSFCMKPLKDLGIEPVEKQLSNQLKNLLKECLIKKDLMIMIV